MSFPKDSGFKIHEFVVYSISDCCQVYPTNALISLMTSERGNWFPRLTWEDPLLITDVQMCVLGDMVATLDGDHGSLLFQLFVAADTVDLTHLTPTHFQVEIVSQNSN